MSFADRSIKSRSDFLMQTFFGRIRVPTSDPILSLVQMIGSSACGAGGVAAVDRALGPSEDVLAHAAVELVFGAGALRHIKSPIRVVSAPGTAPSNLALDAITASPGMRDQLRAAHLGVHRLKVKFSRLYLRRSAVDRAARTP